MTTSTPRTATRRGMARRESPHRRRSGAPLAALGALLAVLAAPLPAQQDDDARGDGLYSLPRSQDDLAELRLALSDLAEKRYETAAERLHRLLREGGHGVVPTLGGVDRWQGVRLAVLTAMRDFPADARAAYERLATREMGPFATLPLDQLGEDELLWLARSFPTASRGIAARLRLGDLALERGDALRACEQFRCADDAIQRDDPRRVALRERRELADLMVRGALDALDGGAPLAGTVESALTALGEGGWPAYGGGYDGGRPMHEPAIARLSPYQLPIEVDGFDLNPFPLHLVGDLTGVFVNDGHSVRALDPIARRLLWEAPGPMTEVEDWGELRDGINRDVILACAASDEIVVAALQVPANVVGASQTRMYRDAIPILQKMPSRRLFAFERSTGKRLWSHWDELEGPLARRFEGHDAAGAPLVHGDTVYAAVHDPTGAISYAIAAYDLQTGELRWRRLICASQQEVNMFGNSRQEFAAGPIAMHAGVVYGTTNLGVVYAVNAEDGSIRWITGYPTISLPPAQLQGQDRRMVYFANNPIVVADGVLATTPLDSEWALGLDLETGMTQWRMRFQPLPSVTVRWLLGALGDEFVFAGDGIVAVRARESTETGRASARLVASEQAVGNNYYRASAVPRGAVTKDRIWFVGADGALRIFDSRGNRDPRANDLKDAHYGNLLLVDGLLAVASDTSVVIWHDQDGLVRDARERVLKRPDDPAAALRLARLERARLGDELLGSSGERVEQLFAHGLELATARGLGPGSRTWQGLADGLFELAFDRARAERDADPANALRRLRRVRDLATEARPWLRVQQEILELVGADDAASLDELARMAGRWPDETFVFRDVGRLRVATYGKLASVARTKDPAAAMQLCQELVTRHGEEQVGERSVRELAVAALERLIERHGREPYAAIEREAGEALTRAADSAEALKQVVWRFPTSEAARGATARMLDAAIERGDLGIAALAYAEATARSAVPASVMRRLLAAAEKRGNQALGDGLAARLVERHGAERSDFAQDGGATYAELFRERRPAELPAPRKIELPVEPIATLTAPNVQSALSLVRVARAPGFPDDDRLPLLLRVDNVQLVGMDLEAKPAGLADARFTVSLRGTADDSMLNEPVLVCGSRLVVDESSRVFALDRASGQVLWELPAGRGRSCKVLGASDGVLVVFSRNAGTHADAALLRMVEPSTGVVLAKIDVAGTTPGVEPILSDGRLWLFDARDQDAVAFRCFDPLDGRELAATPLGAKVLRELGLAGSASHRLAEPGVVGKSFADGERLYVPVDLNQIDEPSRLVALKRGSGEVSWRWSGLPGCSITRIGKRGNRLVIFERSTLLARLSLLDELGSVVASYDFAAQANAQGWADRNSAATAPDPLLITDKSNGTLRLTCVSLQPGGPRFQIELARTDSVQREPIVGDGFLVLPTYVSGRQEPLVQVVDLATRKAALPSQDPALRLGLTRPLRVHAHDGQVVLETLDALRVMGTRR